MQDDVRKIIYGFLLGFIVIILTWIGYLFVVGCNFSLDCESYFNPPEYTPIPTFIYASMPTIEVGESQAELLKCRTTTKTLLGAWVSTEYPENESFSFNSLDNKDCRGEFSTDILPLFMEANLWYPGALACSSCHNSNIEVASAQLDLSSYSGIVLGSRRSSTADQGNDILGMGVWEDSELNNQLFKTFAMPFGRPPDLPEEGPIVFAGSPE